MSKGYIATFDFETVDKQIYINLLPDEIGLFEIETVRFSEEIYLKMTDANSVTIISQHRKTSNTIFANEDYYPHHRFNYDASQIVPFTYSRSDNGDYLIAYKDLTAFIQCAMGLSLFAHLLT